MKPKKEDYEEACTGMTPPPAARVTIPLHLLEDLLKETDAILAAVSVQPLEFSAGW